MTARGWLIAGLILQGVIVLFEAIRTVLVLLAFAMTPSFEWLWVAQGTLAVVGISLLGFARPIADWILRDGGATPAVIDHLDLLRVGAALIGVYLMYEGLRWETGPYGLLGTSFSPASPESWLDYARVLWPSSATGFLAVLVARFLPRSPVQDRAD